MYVFSNLNSAYHQLCGLREFILEDIAKIDSRIEKAIRPKDIDGLKIERAAYRQVVWTIENSNVYMRGK